MDISTAQSIKLAIASATGLSKDALHIYLGMAIYLTLIVGTRRFRVCVRPSHLLNPATRGHGVHLNLSGHQF
jgi:hypothetical protein